MKFLVDNIRVPLDDYGNRALLIDLAAKRLKEKSRNILSCKIVRESVDARQKHNISLVYSVLVEIPERKDFSQLQGTRLVNDTLKQRLVHGNLKLGYRPVIIGTGPAGLFAGLLLAKEGYRPILLERGSSTDKRKGLVQKFWKEGILDSDTNVQFGEGGAGTFSDGKLTTRINDNRSDWILEQFFKAGADESILYKSNPHIGSDVLPVVVTNIREKIIELGGEVWFDSKVTSITIKKSAISSVTINDVDEIPANVVILAIGHSARDTFEMLHKTGVQFEQKPFSIGVRIEHPQLLIDEAQYGEAASHPALGPAEYRLHRRIGDRTVYSFCMCPGGIVVAAASEQGNVVTNGMSAFARDGENANSALVVSVNPADFRNTDPLAGIEFQRMWEKKAFELTKRVGIAPVQTLGDFVEGRKSTALTKVTPTYTGETIAADLNQCLPAFVTQSLKAALPVFDKQVKGFGMKEAVLTGVETRTSSPVRISRGDSFEAMGIKGLYPTGEGAGYAGGIVSAAVDGLRVAEQIIDTYYMP